MKSHQWCLINEYGSGHETVAVLLPGFAINWFCYQLIAKPGNKTATVPWPDPYIVDLLAPKDELGLSRHSDAQVWVH